MAFQEVIVKKTLGPNRNEKFIYIYYRIRLHLLQTILESTQRIIQIFSMYENFQFILWEGLRQSICTLLVSIQAETNRNAFGHYFSQYMVTSCNSMKELVFRDTFGGFINVVLGVFQDLVSCGL